MTPWAPWAVIAIVLAASLAGWALLERRRRRSRRETYVANTGYLTRLPSYRRRLSLQRLAALGMVSLLGIATLFAALLAGRPIDTHLTNERLATRDIVLCLDVSGSMMPFDSQVLRVYSNMVDSFDGERISLNIWNYTTRVVFPLTDDYAMVKEELARGAQIMGINPLSMVLTPGATEAFNEWMTGTYPTFATGASLIGDGLASCVLSFDLADETRSRTIILATDNEPNGRQLLTLAEAADLAAERGARIHAIYASEWPVDQLRNEYEEVVTSRGGLFYELDDPGLAPTIVAEITAEDAAELNASPRVIETDRPDRYYPWLVLFVGLLVIVAWRARA
ncbi:MAG TPA: hypothetical protein VFC82_09085 [Actinomycetaceae bacterium]|nr:hypothetical protein [Actinomycetaceae bacterium]